MDTTHIKQVSAWVGGGSCCGCLGLNWSLLDWLFELSWLDRNNILYYRSVHRHLTWDNACVLASWWLHWNNRHWSSNLLRNLRLLDLHILLKLWLNLRLNLLNLWYYTNLPNLQWNLYLRLHNNLLVLILDNFNFRLLNYWNLAQQPSGLAVLNGH